MNPRLECFIDGIGLLGPGLASWPDAVPVLRGELPHTPAPTVLTPPARLPPAERRRAGAVIRLAMGVADEAVAMAGADAAQLATVFSSSGGDSANCHALCDALAQPNPLVSPTRFTNSVHNAAAGYWHIAVSSRAASTSLCAYDASFAAGLVEAVAALHVSGAPVLLVAYDLPYPEPLHHTRPLPDSLGLAWLLSPQRSARSLARLQLQPLSAPQPTTPCAAPTLEMLRSGIPAAAALPALQAIACGTAATVFLAPVDGLQWQMDLQPA